MKVQLIQDNNWLNICYSVINTKWHASGASPRYVHCIAPQAGKPLMYISRWMQPTASAQGLNFAQSGSAFFNDNSDMWNFNAVETILP